MKAHELLADKSKWCQGSYAQDEHGAWAEIDKACQFCAEGALMKCYPDPDDYNAAAHKAWETSEQIFGRGVIGVNDRLGYDAVMKVLREADV